MNHLKNKEEKQKFTKLFKTHSSGIILLYLALFSLFISCSEVEPPPVVLSSECQLESFAFQPEFNGDLREAAIGKISNYKITVSIPFDMPTDGLIATFVYKGVSIKIGGNEQVSGKTANNFSNPVVYSVIAEDGTKKDYTVIITKIIPTIPKVYINTTGGAPILDRENYVTSTIKIEDLDKYYSDEVQFTSTAGIRGRGNSTWGMPKKPYRIKLDSKASLLGMSTDKDWALLANYLDKSLLRNLTAFEISRKAEMSWTPASISVDFYLNGAYQGVYTLTEHVKVSSERLDMKLVKPTDISGEALTGGYLLELDFHYDEPYKFKTDLKRLPMMFKDPDEPTTEQYAYVKNFYNDAEKVLYSENFKDPVDGYRKYIDIESFINYFIVQEIAKNVDGNMRGSCYMAIRQNGKIEMPLVWDFDIAFGNADHITWEQGATSAEYDGWFIKTCSPWYDRLFEDPYFVAEVKKRWNEVKPKLENLPDYIHKQSLLIKDAQVRNFSPVVNGGAGWDINKVEWNTKRIRGSYDAELSYLMNFVEKRIVWLDTNINKLN
ncbi:MAG: CotH kinase family protein [Dysgonamonadaceae bacterium]|nr:CotH kinase family protein [Dysgonamonadaceae bacterium]